MSQEAPDGATQAEATAFNENHAGDPDFKIRLEEYEWPVHGDVLSESSTFFRAICGGNFKEAEDKLVQLHDDCPFTVAFMLYWFYNPEVKPYFVFKGSHAKKVLAIMDLQGAKMSGFAVARATYLGYTIGQKHALLYLVADKFNIDHLRTKVRDSLRYCFEEDVRTPVSEIVDCLGPVVIRGDAQLLELIFKTIRRQSQDTRAMYEEVKTVFESDPSILDSALDFVFRKVDLNEEKAEKMMEWSDEMDKQAMHAQEVVSDNYAEYSHIDDMYDGWSLNDVQTRILWVTWGFQDMVYGTGPGFPDPSPDNPWRRREGEASTSWARANE